MTTYELTIANELTNARKALAEATDAEVASDYSDAMLSMARAYEEGWVEALEHLTRLLGMPLT